MSQIPGIVWVIVGIGLAIAAPWLLFVALDRQGRDKTGQVWHTSIETISRTLRGEAKDMDELARRVDELQRDRQDRDK